jgi:hypothetical protein
MRGEELELKLDEYLETTYKEIVAGEEVLLLQVLLQDLFDNIVGFKHGFFNTREKIEYVEMEFRNVRKECQKIETRT